jgi:hypothetical protein
VREVPKTLYRLFCATDYGLSDLADEPLAAPSRRRGGGADIGSDFATARACSMKCLANGPGVRPLTVMTAIEYRVAGILAGRIFNPARPALKRATEFGRMPTYLPVPIRAVVS